MATPVNKNAGTGDKDAADDAADNDATIVVDRAGQSLRPGDILRGRFVIERILGEGGMGKVFLAVDREAEQSNPHVAIKVLSGAFKDHPQSLKALRREATQSRQLNHPNIVNVYDFDRDGEHVFMVMEYMRGQSLDTVVERNPSGNRLSEIWNIVQACSEGLAYLHSRHIIHADFKPGNVFVTEDGEIKVLDLGIARIIDETQVLGGTTRFDPNALGALTPQYASCEMFQGMDPNAQDDLYALGCVTYELLTGSHPYGRKNALEARADKLTPKRPRGLKPRQWKALSSALALERAGRPESVSAFLEEVAPTKKGAGARLPWILVSGALVVAFVAAIMSMRTSADAEFVDSVLKRFAGSPNQPVSSDRVDGWMQQAEQSLSLGKAAFQRRETGRAIAHLRTGSSSAYQAYWLVLSRSDNMQAKRRAAEGHLNISKIFKDAARGEQLASAGVEQQLEVICHGLSVNNYEPDLLALAKAFNATVPGGIGSVEPCDELTNTGAIVLK